MRSGQTCDFHLCVSFPFSFLVNRAVACGVVSLFKASEIFLPKILESEHFYNHTKLSGNKSVQCSCYIV